MKMSRPIAHFGLYTASMALSLFLCACSSFAPGRTETTGAMPVTITENAAKEPEGVTEGSSWEKTENGPVDEIRDQPSLPGGVVVMENDPIDPRATRGLATFCASAPGEDEISTIHFMGGILHMKEGDYAWLLNDGKEPEIVALSTSPLLFKAHLPLKFVFGVSKMAPDSVPTPGEISTMTPCPGKACLETLGFQEVPHAVTPLEECTLEFIAQFPKIELPTALPSTPEIPYRPERPIPLPKPLSRTPSR